MWIYIMLSAGAWTLAPKMNLWYDRFIKLTIIMVIKPVEIVSASQVHVASSKGKISFSNVE